MDNGNQLSRYGAIAKMMPFMTGKAFFLVNSSETAAAEFLNKYGVDLDGVTRVYTTWASVIAAVQLSTDADVIFVSPLFTTAPTLAQIASLDAAGVTVIQAGSLLPDGSYLATKAAAALPQTTTTGIFAVNGKVRLLDIIGEVVTTIGATTAAVKLTVVPNVGSTTDICATSTAISAPVGALLTITGVPTAAMVVTTQSAVVSQASPLIITAGQIYFNCASSTPGNIKWRLRYVPLDPGAFVSAL